MGELIRHLYKSDRDSDGTPNCGLEDYYYIHAFNDGLTASSKVYEKELDELKAENERLKHEYKLYQKGWEPLSNYIQNDLKDSWKYAGLHYGGIALKFLKESKENE